MKRISILLALVIVLVLAGSVLAMSSTHYLMNWFVPMTGSGGGEISSAHCAIDFTVGQSVGDTSSSTNHGGCLGYWCGTQVLRKVYLPALLLNH